MCWQLHWKARTKPSNHTFLNTAPLWAVRENKGISLCLSNKRKKNQCLCLSSCHSNRRNVLRFHLFVRAWKFNFFDVAADILACLVSSIYALMISPLYISWRVSVVSCLKYRLFTCYHPAVVLSCCKWTDRMTFQSLCCLEPGEPWQGVCKTFL